MRFYHGERNHLGHEIDVIDRSNPQGGYPLNPRDDLWFQNGEALSWGNAGPSASRLALALLCDALGNDERAESVMEDFKARVIAPMAEDEWELSQEDIRQTVRDIEGDRRADKRENPAESVRVKEMKAKLRNWERN